MADVRFEIAYEVNENAPIPSPKATLTMKIKADENGDVPVNVRCMDRVLGEAMARNWGSPHRTHGWRTKEIPIESESWTAVQARVEEHILGALAKMQEADERYQRLVAEQPADYVYETSVPGPENPVQTQYKAEPLHKVDGTIDEEAAEADIDNREWAMRTFGLSQLPCESAANFLMEYSNEIARYGEQAYGQWSHLSQRMRFQAGVEWLEEYCDVDDGDGDARYTIADWIEWARNHRA